MTLPVLYRDDHYIAVHKPPNLLVHRSWLASQETRFLLQMLRDQIGQRVYPVHRLDRATSGVIIFGLSADAARDLSHYFEHKQVRKVYHALARGWTDEQGEIDHPVRDRDEGGEPKAALTHYRRLARIELPYAVDRYPSSRYSLVEVRPQTGRRHQIRQHFKHIFHPLVGDTTYGNGRHNRFFREHFGLQRLLLVSCELGFSHPYNEQSITIRAEHETAWQPLLDDPRWQWDGTAHQGS